MKRHRDALAISLGAVNPSGIAYSIIEACKEMRDNPNHGGTVEIMGDPAVRLMVHQLAYLCNVRQIDHELGVYTQLVAHCEALKETCFEAVPGWTLADTMPGNDSATGWTSSD